MHIGALHSDPTFVAMIMELNMEWDTLAKYRVLKNVVSKIIADDVLLYGCTAKHFITVLHVIKHHRATLKLKTC